MRGLEGLELAEEPIVLGVRDLGRVEDVVGVVGALDLLPQAGDLLGWRHGSDNSTARQIGVQPLVD